MHFPEDGPGGGATDHAVRSAMEAWRPRRGADWAELMARAEGARVERVVLAAAGVALVAAGVVAAAVAAAAHALPPGLEAVRDRLLP